MRRILLSLAAALALRAEAPIEAMKQQAVMIVAAAKVDGKLIGGTGSGFPVDDRHIVTNWHVCCAFPPQAESIVRVVFGQKDIAPARVLWSAPQLDLALIELEKPHARPPVTLAVRKFLKEGQDVWAIGFPGASPQQIDDQGVLTPTISRGIVSKFAEFPRVENGPRVGHIQMTAAVNPGNSGGPLFDECGQVAGINVSKATAKVDNNVTFAEGINLSIVPDELLPEMDRRGIKYKTATAACAVAGAAPGVWAMRTQVATLAIALAALGLSLQRRIRARISQRLSPAPTVPTAPAAAQLRGLSGLYAGQSIPLSARPCILGRDPAAAQLVFTADSTHVSKRHCQLRVDQGRILLSDAGSSNGTFLADGQRLAAGREIELRPGDRFYLGNRDNLFEVTR